MAHDDYAPGPDLAYGEVIVDSPSSSDTYHDISPGNIGNMFANANVRAYEPLSSGDFRDFQNEIRKLSPYLPASQRNHLFSLIKKTELKSARRYLTTITRKNMVEIRRWIEHYDPYLTEEDRYHIKATTERGDFESAREHIETYVVPRAQKAQQEREELASRSSINKEERNPLLQIRDIELERKRSGGGTGKDSAELERLYASLTDEQKEYLNSHPEFFEGNPTPEEERNGLGFHKDEEEANNAKFTVGLNPERLPFIRKTEGFINQDRHDISNLDFETLKEYSKNLEDPDIINQFKQLGYSEKEISNLKDEIDTDIESLNRPDIKERTEMNVPLQLGYKINPNTRVTAGFDLGIGGKNGVSVGGSDKAFNLGFSHKFGGGEKSGPRKANVQLNKPSKPQASTLSDLHDLKIFEKDHQDVLNAIDPIARVARQNRTDDSDLHDLKIFEKDHQDVLNKIDPIARVVRQNRTEQSHGSNLGDRLDQTRLEFANMVFNRFKKMKEENDFLKSWHNRSGWHDNNLAHLLNIRYNRIAK